MSAMEIRRMTPDDVEQYNDLLRYAFQVTEKTLLDYGWENDDIRRSKFPILSKASVLGWFDDERLASQFAVFPLQMNVHGNIQSIGFITSVATYPEYSGQGLMSALMKRSLAEMREKGQSLALLYPYSIPLYRRRGFEIVSDKMSFLIMDSQLPKHVTAPGHVRRVRYNHPDLLNLHERFARRRHGCILRNDLAWEEYWRWDVEDITTAIYYGPDEKPHGYMVYVIREDMMHIKEMIYLDMEAWKGLWKFIGAHESMVDSVRGDNYSSEPVAFWLEDSDIKETIRPYIMGRIVDVGRFMEQYRFTAIKRDESLSFRIEDPFLEWNNTEFTVRFSRSGETGIVPGVEGRVVELDIGALTTILLGYKRPSYLCRLERIAMEPDALHLLESVVSADRPYISDYI